MVGLGGVFPPSFPGFDPGVIHMALGEAGYVGVVRVEGGHLNIAAALDSGALKECRISCRPCELHPLRRGMAYLPGEPEWGGRGPQS